MRDLLTSKAPKILATIGFTCAMTVGLSSCILEDNELFNEKIIGQLSVIGDSQIISPPESIVVTDIKGNKAYLEESTYSVQLKAHPAEEYSKSYALELENLADGATFEFPVSKEHFKIEGDSGVYKPLRSYANPERPVIGISWKKDWDHAIETKGFRAKSFSCLVSGDDLKACRKYDQRKVRVFEKRPEDIEPQCLGQKYSEYIHRTTSRTLITITFWGLKGTGKNRDLKPIATLHSVDSQDVPMVSVAKRSSQYIPIETDGPCLPNSQKVSPGELGDFRKQKNLFNDEPGNARSFERKKNSFPDDYQGSPSIIPSQRDSTRD